MKRVEKSLLDEKVKQPHGFNILWQGPRYMSIIQKTEAREIENEFLGTDTNYQ